MTNNLKRGFPSAWEQLNSTEREAVFALSEDYKQFLTVSKTERETIKTSIERAIDHGFNSIQMIDRLKPGDKVFAVNRGKALAMAIIGSHDIKEGLQIIAAHVDSPHLDLKVQPIDENAGLALLKTHYYGGIKKYHWLSIPLALHGIIVKTDGRIIPVVIGEKEEEPVFTISDLLPHLAGNQMEKKMRDAINGESLNLLAGSIPSANASVSGRVKQAILDYLELIYDISAEDFVSAELAAVPAWKARDVGLDRSLVAGYGQDDRVSVYTAIRALEEITLPIHTALVLLVDREEVGNTGNTGMQAAFFANFVAELTARVTDYSDLLLRKILASSRALAADVKGAFDPNYPDVADELNAAHLGCGLVLTRHPNSMGKKGGHEAHAEYVGYIRNLFNKKQVVWQPGQLGKVDLGGSGAGSFSYLLAAYGMDVLDLGVPLLGMHSPFEVANKADIYMAYKGYNAFFESII